MWLQAYKICIGRSSAYTEPPDGKPGDNMYTHDAHHQHQRLDILRSDLNDMIQQLPVEETATRKKIMEVVVAMYGEIDPREYETYRLTR